jgi:hypothetical protein
VLLSLEPSNSGSRQRVVAEDKVFEVYSLGIARRLRSCVDAYMVHVDLGRGS